MVASRFISLANRKAKKKKKKKKKQKEFFFKLPGLAGIKGTFSTPSAKKNPRVLTLFK